MRPDVRSVHDLVSNIDPLDDLEREHISDSLAWIEGTNDIFRRVKPAIPSRHLVSYVVVVDPSDTACSSSITSNLGCISPLVGMSNPASILWLRRDGRRGKSSG